jgi:N-acetylglutamate synthase-like GNAT family acetyltransferase
MIDRAQADDLQQVLALVADAGLPTDGIVENFPQGYFIYRSQAGIEACAGLEIYATFALLRSVCVAQKYRGQGFAQKLVAALVDRARSQDVCAIYLLTQNAADYFTRLGFVPTPRDKVPNAVAQAREFTTICPSSAQCLVRFLDEKNPTKPPYTTAHPQKSGPGG